MPAAADFHFPETNAEMHRSHSMTGLYAGQLGAILGFP
jgi:hypothetical protein